MTTPADRDTYCTWPLWRRILAGLPGVRRRPQQCLSPDPFATTDTGGH